MRLNLQVKLYPTKQMRTYLDSQCDYRRYCWNKGLEVWNDFYDQRMISLPTELKLKIKESLNDKSIQFTEEEMNLRKEFPSPTERHVRNELVANKSDWEYENSARVLQLAIKDLSDISKDFLDVETTTGVERVTENNDALNIIQNALANENDVTLTPSDLMDLTIDERHL